MGVALVPKEETAGAALVWPLHSDKREAGWSSLLLILCAVAGDTALPLYE